MKAESEGTVLLPGGLFADVVRSLPAGDVSLELRGEQRDVEIAAGGARSPSDSAGGGLPRLPAFEGDSVRAGEPLATTIDLVARTSRDEVRPILTGVLLQAEARR